MDLPAAFVEQMRRQLGPIEAAALFDALNAIPPTSIRPNPIKRAILQENFEGVKWYSDGVYLPERPSFTLDPLWHAGAYYVQEASSMFVAEAVRQLFSDSTPRRALDVAAAPGGKATLLASMVPTDTLVLANEVIRGRYGMLRENISRWGYPNLHAANHDPRDFRALAGFFDLALVDAPCSGEGLFRKDSRARAEWSPELTRLCAARQQRILAEAAPLVRPGGALLYCTCTFNDLENEDNARWLIEHFDFDHAPLEVPAGWGVVERALGYQFFPHRLRGEGFYLACFRKKGLGAPGVARVKSFPQLSPLPRRQVDQLKGWVRAEQDPAFFLTPQGRILALPAGQLDDARALGQALSRLSLGVSIGSFKHDKLVPAPELALSIWAHPDLPASELPLPQALRYLKGEAPALLAGIPNGWRLARFQGLNLGWMKALDRRLNNYHPKEWRIRMELPET
jgi:16S rRNA C967 or C1407 C5-methylase (RsmB/RsmF family)/NOL1/NOP2/fmu family ribosome biogenesis protein